MNKGLKGVFILEEGEGNPHIYMSDDQFKNFIPLERLTDVSEEPEVLAEK